MSDSLFTFLLGMWLMFFVWIISVFNGHERKEPLEPTIKIENVNGVSDTTYVYYF